MNFEKISKYDIKIRHTVNGGVIVKVGCAELSFSNPEDMMDVMKQYYENPQEMEKLFNKSNASHPVEEAVEESIYEETQPQAQREVPHSRRHSIHH
jgi:hypothetical protein